MLDDPDERCKTDGMISLREYEEEVERIRQENERQLDRMAGLPRREWRLGRK
jgi:hypothetical protein